MSINAMPSYTNEEDIRVERDVETGRETWIFDPYNSYNREITARELHGLLAKYGVQRPIRNFKLYQRAFVHRSYVKRPQQQQEDRKIQIVACPSNCLPLHTKSNERLEFVGDGVLECFTKHYLYCRFPKENEGFMTEKKIALVKNESIGKIAYEIGLHHWFVLSKNAEIKNTRRNYKKLGCLFESFLGALFLDFEGDGFHMSNLFLHRVFEQHVDWIELIRNDDNYKNMVQVIIQKEFKVTPHYLELNNKISEEGYCMGVFLCLGQPIHGASLDRASHINDLGSFSAIHQHVHTYGNILVFLGRGHHTIKKKAEQLACEDALANLQRFGVVPMTTASTAVSTALY